MLFWLFFSLSLLAFLIYLLQAYFVEGRTKTAINTEGHHARRIARLSREDFMKENATTIQIVGVFLGTSCSLTVAAVIAWITVNKKHKPASIVVFISSALPTLCFALFLKMLDDAKPDAHGRLEDQQKMEALLFKAFLIRRLGYRLFFFTVALCMGWIHPIAMFGATVVLLLIYIIIDIRAFIVSHQTTRIPLSLLRSDPIQLETHHVQVLEVALSVQNGAAQQVDAH